MVVKPLFTLSPKTKVKTIINTKSLIKTYKNIRISGVVSCAILIVLTFFACFPGHKETDTLAAGHAATASVISFNSVRNIASVTIDPTSTGVFGSSDNNSNISFSISSNNYTGYTLTVRSNKTTLDNGDNSFSPLASNVTATQFAASGNTTLNNRWGYQPNYYNSTANTNYLVPPSSTSVTLDATTTASTTAKNYTINLGARADTSIASGTYLNSTFILEYIANPVPYTINFNDNATGDIASNIPNTISGNSVTASTIALPATVPTRANYTFAGWCTGTVTHVAGGDHCSNYDYYQAGDDYGIDYTGTNTATLTAMWTSNEGCNKVATTIATGVASTDAVCMQDINDAVISTMVAGTQYTLKDMRDGKSYYLAKQADGKVWMTQNLDYDLNTSTTLTYDNTDLGHVTGDNTTTWTSSTSSIVNASVWNMSSQNLPYSFNPGDIYYYTSGSTSDDTLYSSTSACTTAHNDGSCAHYHVGNYYTWTAAAASNDSNSIVSSIDHVNQSVCPAGWRLPRGQDVYAFSEVNNLLYKVGAVNRYVATVAGSSADWTTNGFNNVRTTPLYFNRTGAIWTSSVSYAGTNGYYWNDNVASEISATASYFTKDSFNVSGTLTRRNGFPIRCVARMNTGTTTVNFNGNGAENTMSPVTVETGQAVKLTNIFKRTGYQFTGWNTAANGSGTSYSDTDAIVDTPPKTVTVNLYAQWNPVFRITYDGNGADNPDAMPIKHEVAENASVTLVANNYTRAGYGFAGWSQTQIDGDAADVQSRIALAKVYGPNETITASASELGKSFPNDFTLYAVWVKSEGNIQDWKGCTSLGAGNVTALTDTRDNETYAVGKLPDGQCWMIENLRLNDANSAYKSNSSQGFGGVFVGLPSSEVVTFSYNTQTNSRYTFDQDSTTLQVISGNAVSNRMPHYNGQHTTNAASSIYYNTQNNRGYGNYYNWASAMASTNEFTSSTTSEAAGTSICPSGWRLPTGTSSGEFENLNTLLESGATNTSTKFTKFPQNMVHAGYIWNGTLYSLTTTYYYWSSSNSHQGYSYALGSGNTPHSGTNNNVGASVRCIAENRVEVRLYANDGSGRVARLYGNAGDTLTLPSPSFQNIDHENKTITSWNTNSGGTGTSYTTTYTIPTGSSVFSLYGIWSNTYTIRYNGNGSTGITTMDAASQTGIVNDSSVRLLANGYSRGGYGFVGWSRTQIDPNSSNYSTLLANAKVYGPNELVTANSTNFGATAPSTVTLYAVWIKSSGNLQGWTGCGSLTMATYNNGTITPGSIIGLTDTRDTRVYAVARLTDGNCWMIENLKLGSTGSTDSTKARGFGGVFSGLATSENANFANVTTANTLYSTTNITGDNVAYRFPRHNSKNTDIISPSYDSGGEVFGYGNYYTWAAAMANTSDLTSYQASDATGTSICPTGWDVPLGYTRMTNLAYSYLDTTIGGTGVAQYSTTQLEKWHQFPFNLINSGYMSGASISGRGTMGYNWSRSATSTTNAAAIGITSTYVAPGTNNLSKTFGFTLRCVIAGTSSMTISNISTMQQLSTITINDRNSVINSMTTGAQYQLRDTRETNKYYYVSKLADGKVWMTQNLDLDLSTSKTLTHEDTDLGWDLSSSVRSWTPSRSTINATGVNNNYITGWAESDTTPYSVDPGDWYWDNTWYTSSSYYNYLGGTASPKFATSAFSGNGVHGHVGNFYNWSAAIATNDSSSISSSVLAPNSICPAGWKLPSASDYYSLMTNYGSPTTDQTFTSSPLYFLRAGEVNASSQLNGPGYNGGYWQSQGSSSTQSIYLTFTSSYIGNYLSDRDMGHNIRCVLRGE